MVSFVVVLPSLKKWNSLKGKTWGGTGKHEKTAGQALFTTALRGGKS